MLTITGEFDAGQCGPSTFDEVAARMARTFASSLQDDGRSGCAVLLLERTTSPRSLPQHLRLRRRRTEFVLQGVHDTVDVLRRAQAQLRKSAG